MGNRRRDEERKAWLIVAGIIVAAVAVAFFLTKDFRQYLRDYDDFQKYKQYVLAGETENEPDGTVPAQPDVTDNSQSGNQGQQPSEPATPDPQPQPQEPIPGYVLAGSRTLADVSGNVAWEANTVSEETAGILHQYVEERKQVYTWENTYDKTLKINELDRKILSAANCSFPNVSISFVGDSITEGVGGNEDASGNKISYVNYVQEALHFGTVTNNGVAGSTIGDYMTQTDLSIAYNQDKLFDAKNMITVFYAGLNDYLYKPEVKNFGVLNDGSTGGYCGQLQMLLRSFPTAYPNTKFFIVTAFQTTLDNGVTEVTNFDGIPTLNDYMQPQRLLAAECGYPVIDLYNIGFMDMHDEQTAAALLADSTHPNDTGYRILGEHIAVEILLYYLGIN